MSSVSSGIHGKKNINTNHGLFVIEPKATFLEWTRSAAAEYNISPSDILSQITPEALSQHALVMMAEPCLSLEKEQLFIKTHLDLIFKTMLESWIFPDTCWPKNRGEDVFERMYSVYYFPYLVDLFQSREHAQPGDLMSVFLIKPKAPVIEWFNKLYTEKLIFIPNAAILKPEVFKKMGTVCIMAPMFTEYQTKEPFIRKNYLKIFEFCLTQYCSDPSIWMKDLSYEAFLNLFDCQNYSPILSSKIWGSSAHL